MIAQDYPKTASPKFLAQASFARGNSSWTASFVRQR